MITGVLANMPVKLKSYPAGDSTLDSSFKLADTKWRAKFGEKRSAEISFWNKKKLYLDSISDLKL